MTLPFTKLTGAGNDFVLIDNREETRSLQWERIAQILCDRHFGIGADGLLVLEDSDRADYMMNYFNADGSYGGMCGNGARCAALYYFENESDSNLAHFEVLGHIYTAEESQHSIKIKMRDITYVPHKKEIDVEKYILPIHFIELGNSPHTGIFFEELLSQFPAMTDVAQLHVRAIGQSIRFHTEFIPHGTNVDFIQKKDDATILLRTYERGVEDETLACGTGCVASAILSAEKYTMRSPVHIIPTGKKPLTVFFKKEGNTYSEIWLEGETQLLFQSTVTIDNDTYAIK